MVNEQILVQNTEPYLLEVENASFFFNQNEKDEVRAINGISFKLKAGETLGVVGESGSGKSTLARLIVGLLKPISGRVLFEEADLTLLSKKERLKKKRDMQMIFQDPHDSLDPRMTVGELIAEPLRIYKKHGLIDISKKEIIERVKELMRKVGLQDIYINRFAHEFSGGQRQRIGIARALALEPKLILADEPVSALDVSIQAQILNLLKELQSELGLTYLFISHDLAVIRHISNRIMVMYLGKIVELAQADELYDNPLHPYTEALLSAAPIPDPEIERNRRRILLEGDLNSAITKRNVCFFYDRCPKRHEQCLKAIPPLREVKEGHYVACVLYDEW